MAASPWTQESYLKAFRFAAKAHSGQTVTGTELPYLAHVTMVAMEVMAALATEQGLDGDLAVQCALLHDVIEDTHVSSVELGREFGPALARGVMALSKDPGLPESAQLRDSLRRISAEPREVWIVKLADRITNLQPPPRRWSREKIVVYRQEAKEILDTLGAASRVLGERLAEKIARYADFAKASV